MKKSRFVFIFLGPPGSGKGTQSDVLGEKLKYPVISTGELLRREEALKSDLGLKARRYIKRGVLVPDLLIQQMIERRLAKRDTARGFILDGYPRDGKQLDDMNKLLQDKYQIWFVEVKINDREALNRISGRRVCDCGASYHLVYNPSKKSGLCDLCGKKIYIREDDKPAVVRQRLSDYQDGVAPLLAFAKKRRRLIGINGRQSIAKVRHDIWHKVAKIIA